MQREKDCHTKNKTFGELVKASSLADAGDRAIPSDWVYKIKYRGGPTNISQLEDRQFKARVVVRGQFMRQGVDFNDTYAPVAKPATLRALLATAAKYDCLLHSGDVETAFLTASMDTLVHVKMPPFWGEGDDPVSSASSSGEIRRLLKGVPGIPQGSRLFYRTFADQLRLMGYQASEADECLFINETLALTERNAVLLWVDDFIFMCQRPETKESFFHQLREKFSIQAFQPVATFLGMEITRDREARTIHVSQANTVRVLLERADMQSCNSASSPVVTGATFTKSDSPSDAAANETTASYRSLVALLNFIACWTRPDITFVVNKLCKFMSNPGEAHWKHLKHLIRYMQGTVHWGLSFAPSAATAPLQGYSDSSFGDCPDTGRSTLAYVFLYHGGILSWYSKLCGYVTLSTNQSEYAALALASREAEWLIQLCAALEPATVVTPVPIFVDNAGVVSLVFNPVDHQANKHIKLSCHYARELTERKTIIPVKVASEENLADLFTKALPTATHLKLATRLLCRKPNHETCAPRSESALMFTHSLEATESDAETSDTFVEEGARTKQSARQRAREVQAIVDRARLHVQDGTQWLTEQQHAALSTSVKQESPTSVQHAEQLNPEGKKRKDEDLVQPSERQKRVVKRLPGFVQVPIVSVGEDESEGDDMTPIKLEIALVPTLTLRRSNRAPVQPVRSFSTRICYLPPAARGTFYHLASCSARPPLGNYANIEYAHALMMKPAWCSCNDAELNV